MALDFVLVTDETTRDELLELLHLKNGEAKAMGRRGKSQRLRPEYARLHAILNDIITDLELGWP